ncbi:MAG: TM2 domain-containing protein [Planctomycetaceae bacterium]|nr:TM2 domain-containing protein [Planctomycetaceae bacterium]
MSDSSPEPKIDLKNPIVAALLGFLVPGGGHFYQGRTFKGVIYLVCILSLFIWGMQIGHWQLIYRYEPNKTFDFDVDSSQFEMFDENDLRRQLEELGPSRTRGRTHWGYFAQLPVGLFIIPEYIQEGRYYSPDNLPVTPESGSFDEQVSGSLEYVNDEGKEFRVPVTGQLKLSVQEGEFGREMVGSITGQSDGEEIDVRLRGDVRMDPPVGAKHYRNLRVNAIALGESEIIDGVLTAQLDRSVFNWFLVPPDHQTLEGLHADLGKKFTLAEVFTWVAGLLNVLAIWDAYAGPAYGYRMPIRKKDSSEEEESESEEEAAASESEPAKSPTENQPT